MKKLLLMAVVLAAAVAGATATGPSVEASPSPSVELVGAGDYATDEWGLTGVHAQVSGRPFNGSFSGGLLIDGRQFPEPGACHAADILFIVEQGRRWLDFITWGEICGVEGGGPVEYVYTGDYDLYDASAHRNLVNTQGWMEVRLLTDGGAAVTVVDS